MWPTWLISRVTIAANYDDWRLTEFSCCRRSFRCFLNGEASVVYLVKSLNSSSMTNVAAVPVAGNNRAVMKPMLQLEVQL